MGWVDERIRDGVITQVICFVSQGGVFQAGLYLLKREGVHDILESRVSGHVCHGLHLDRRLGWIGAMMNQKGQATAIAAWWRGLGVHRGFEAGEGKVYGLRKARSRMILS